MVKPRLQTQERGIYDKRTITVIETEGGERYSQIPIRDFELLMDMYSSLPHPKLQNPNWVFVNKIDARMGTEWCANYGCGYGVYYPVCSSDHYYGEGFKDFVRDETHLELEREGYPWNGKESRFENLNPEQYEQARKRVLGGLTLRAIELFTDWNGNFNPQKIKGINDPRNLRTNLERYIRQYEELAREASH